MRTAAAWLLACWLPWAGAQPLALPADLAQWRAAHPLVRWAPEQDYAPMVYRGADGQPAGLSVELLQRVARQAGLQLQALPAGPLPVLLRDAAERRLDLLTSLRPTPERVEHLVFTRAYVSVPAVVVQRASGPLLPGPQALAGRAVAVGQGYAVEAVMRQRHPRVTWQAVATDAEGLAGVAQGRFDAAVADAASVAYIVQRDRLSGLVVSAQVGYDYDLAFAVRRDWPQLRDILDLAIAAVPLSERQALLQRWLPSGPAGQAPMRSPRATRLGLGLLAVAGVAGLWGLAHRRWRRQRRTQELADG